MRNASRSHGLLLCWFLLALSMPVLAQTTVSVFTGGDAGEGLDLDGVFVYAVNARGPATGAVRDATFTTDAAAGVTLTSDFEILNWTSPDFGASANDDNLEIVMQSIRWSASPNAVRVDLANLQPGSLYKLQLLFGEQCCSRGFDVSVEGTLIADDFGPFQVQGGTDTTAQDNGAVVTHTLFAGDDTLSIVLGGTDTVHPDDNAILQGFTLELLPPPVPTLSTWMLLTMVALLAGAALLVLRSVHG